MHMDEASCPCPLVQVINVLRNDQQIARPMFVQVSQRKMSGIRLNILECQPAAIIKIKHKSRVYRQRFGSADIFDPMALP